MTTCLMIRRTSRRRRWVAAGPTMSRPHQRRPLRPPSRRSRLVAVGPCTPRHPSWIRNWVPPLDAKTVAGIASPPEPRHPPADRGRYPKAGDRRARTAFPVPGVAYGPQVSTLRHGTDTFPAVEARAGKSVDNRWGCGQLASRRGGLSVGGRRLGYGGPEATPGSAAVRQRHPKHCFRATSLPAPQRQ